MENCKHSHLHRIHVHKHTLKLEFIGNKIVSKNLVAKEKLNIKVIQRIQIIKIVEGKFKTFIVENGMDDFQWVPINLRSCYDVNLKSSNNNNNRRKITKNITKLNTRTRNINDVYSVYAIRIEEFACIFVITSVAESLIMRNVRFVCRNPQHFGFSI